MCRSAQDSGRLDVLGEHMWLWGVKALAQDRGPVDDKDVNPTFTELRDLFECVAPEGVTHRSFASFIAAVEDNAEALEPITRRWPGARAGKKLASRVEAIVKKVLPQLGTNLVRSIGPARCVCHHLISTLLLPALSFFLALSSSLLAGCPHRKWWGRFPMYVHASSPPSIACLAALYGAGHQAEQS